MTNLTEKQAQAAHHYDGPAIVTAGPGSGKTRVLIERIKFLIKEKGVPPDRILAVTFTEKATAQMQARLFAAVGDGAESVHVSTIHSLCRTLMEDYFTCHEFGASFTVMDEETQRLFVNAHRRELELVEADYRWLPLIVKAAGHERDYEAQVCALYNALTENDVDPAVLAGGLAPLGTYRDDALALLKSHGTYRDLLRRSKQVDFAHLQSIALGILKTREEALADVRRRFAFALVDEYQDTSPAQDELIRLIAEGGNVFVVGDENQSIYGFRGADVKNFRKFPKRFPKAARYFLMTNFRSGKTIVEAANLLIEKKIKETLEAHRARGNEIILVTGENRAETARHAAAFIKKKISEGRLGAGDAAFLYRKKCLADDVHAALEEAGLPFVTDAGGGILDRREARDLVNVFGYVHQKSVAEDEFKNWGEWWRTDVFDNEIVSLSKKTTAILHDLPRDKTIGDATTEEKVRALGVTDKADAKVIAELNALKARVEEGKHSLLESLYEIFRISGCLSRLLSHSSKGNEEKLLRLAALTALVQKYESAFARPSARNLLWFLHNKTMEGGDAVRSDEGAAVKCLTVHKAKGLEFPAVVVCSLLEGDFPLAFREKNTICGVPIPQGLLKTAGADEDSHYDEELRLFYVAVTRAQDLLVLCLPEKKIKNKGRPSRFLKIIEKYVTGRVDSDIVMEKKYEAPPQDVSLSYSAAHTYRECPFLYKLVYGYGFAAPADPNQKHGVIVHNVLQKVNWAIQHGEDTGEEALKKIIDESWVPIYGPKRDEKSKGNYLANTRKYVEHARNNFSAIESFEKPFTYIDLNMIVRGKTDLVARDREGKKLLIDFKARTMKGIEKTGVEDQLRVYHRCLKDPSIERLATYTFFDSQFKDYVPDDRAAAELLAGVSAGLAAESFPRRRWDDVCGECHFKFLCQGTSHE
jgi:DNA helicase-2/ATP-dependent DNA helicase PcrA